MKLSILMIPEIAMFWVNFNGIGTQELPSRREDQQKSVNTDFQFYESAKASSVWKYLQPKFRLASVLQNCVALVFKNGSLLCSLCCIAVQI
jgi:hypothetical protein